MSGLVGTSDFMLLWQQSSQAAERKLQKILEPMLDEYVKAESDFLAKIKVGPTCYTPVIRWLEEEGYPDAVTGQLSGTPGAPVVTFTGNLFGAAVSADSLLKIIRVGTILLRPSDGLQLRVASVAGIIDGGPFTVTAAKHGNAGTLGDDGGAITYQIIGELWTDFREVDSTRSLDRTFREVGTQIHAETFEIPKTRKNTKYEIVGDEVEHQIAALLAKLRRSLAHGVMKIEPYYSAGYKFGNQVEESSMCSIRTWAAICYAEDSNANCYKNMASTALTRTPMDKFIRDMWLERHANFNSGNWQIVCHPSTQDKIAAMDITMRQTQRNDKGVGVEVDTFHAGIGKSFPILADPYMLETDLWVINMDAIDYRYYAQDKIDRKEIATKGRFQQWLVSFQTAGVVFHNPKKNLGMMYGIAG